MKDNKQDACSKTDKQEMIDAVCEVKDRFGAPVARDIIRNIGFAEKLANIDPRLYSDVITACNDKLNNKKARGRSRKTSMPKAIAAPYGGSPERQFSATAQGIVIDSREKAAAYVAELQRKWDLIDEATNARELMDRMEERHGDEFEAFLEATILQIMRGSGMTQVVIDTNEVAANFLTRERLVCREEQGKLIYELAEDAPDADVEHEPGTTVAAHDLYETGDSDAPEAIKDRNGEVVLNMCRRCGKAEVELDTRDGCEGRPDAELH